MLWKALEVHSSLALPLVWADTYCCQLLPVFILPRFSSSLKFAPFWGCPSGKYWLIRRWSLRGRSSVILNSIHCLNLFYLHLFCTNTISHYCTFYTPNFEKVEGAYCFGLVRPSVRTKIKLGFLNFIDRFPIKNS